MGGVMGCVLDSASRSCEEKPPDSRRGGGPGQASAAPYSEMGGEAEPGRCGWSLRSVTLVRVLSVDNFNMGEGEEAPPPVDLPLPLAVDVHPGHLNDVADLGKQDQMGGA